MKKKPLAPLVVFSTFCALGVAAEEAEEMTPLVVEGSRIADVSGTQVKSADLAEALFKNMANVSLVRRSGIANDIILRGQKKDNINILIDDAKIYGACPNRMDPPTSHILTNNVEAVEVTEGPYDVENFGTLSGAVKITTREPEAGMLHGDVSLNVGRWNYVKGAATLTGGSDRIQALVTLSREESDQYEDGDGQDFVGQIQASGSAASKQYKTQYEHQKAYEKSTFMGKLHFDLAENQKLKLSYTANRSNDVLYPNTPMDALYDDSDLYTLDYVAQDLGTWSEVLEISLYSSKVDHPMSNFYRNSSGPNSANEKTHHLKSKIKGAKVKNRLKLNDGTLITLGLDFSRRNWDGRFEKKGSMAWMDGFISIDDVDTSNRALFLEAEKDFDALNLKVGARYDDTSIDPAGNQPGKDYKSFSAFLFGRYALNGRVEMFAGLGRSYRVPDARELYYQMPKMQMTPGTMVVGNPDLDQTRNTEIDFGVETETDNLYLKAKLFYSWLGDFIFYNDSKMMYKFENMDATLWGFSLNGSWNFTDALWLDFGLAYQRGEKKDPLTGQSDTDMPEIPPLKGNLALNWQYTPAGLARAEFIASDAWTRYDEDNGEQRLSGWGILNLNVRHQLTERVLLTGGIDNVFDKTYATSNTYKDLTLLTAGGGDVMLLNEPGRYFYLNASYTF